MSQSHVVMIQQAIAEHQQEIGKPRKAEMALLGSHTYHRKPLSKAAKERISKAQKARWAKQKKVVRINGKRKAA